MLVAGVSLAVLVAPARAGAAGLTYSISPTSGPPGTVITYTGTGCADSGTGVDGGFVLVTLPGGNFSGQTQTQFNVLANGTFTGQLRVPAGLAPGTYATGISCYAGPAAGWPQDPGHAPFVVGAAAPDTTPPTISKVPTAALRPGTVSSRAVPVRVAWGTSDPSGICHQTLTLPGGRVITMAKTLRSVLTYVAPGRAVRWTLEVADCAGNSRRAVGASTIAAINPQNAATGYTGRWSVVRSTALLGGSERVTKAAGAKVAMAVTARSVGLVATRGPGRGKAAVYVDGRRVATVDFYAKRAQVRQQVWVTAWTKSGRHTVRIVNLATKGRPVIGVDALTTVR
jgi:hypothetical protein